VGMAIRKLSDTYGARISSSACLQLKRYSIRFVSFVLALIALFSCLPGDGRAYVFAANFYSAPVSLRVGVEPLSVYAVDDLPPGGVSGLAAAGGGGEYPVLCRPSGRDGWQRLPGEFESSLCRLAPGSVTAVVVDRRGFIRAYTLGDDPRPGARLCFLNAADANLANAAVAVPGRSSFPVFRSGGLAANAATRFRSVLPGDYRLSAQPATLPGAVPGRSGLEADLSCADASYWLLYCCVQDNAIVLHSVLLGTRENGRITPAARR
jgi:hypothetical protein